MDYAVIDSSVAIKWHVVEPYSTEARRLLSETRDPFPHRRIASMNRVLAFSFIALAGCGAPDDSFDDVVTNLDDKADNTMGIMVSR